MDVSKTTDINTLKIMAYDALAQKQLIDQNLQIINSRIRELVTIDANAERVKEIELAGVRKAGLKKKK